MSTATSVSSALSGFRWERLRPMLDDEATDPQAARALGGLRAALRNDEIVTSLPADLRTFEDELFRWLELRRPVPPPPPPPPPPLPGGSLTLGDRQEAARVVDQLQSFLDAHPGARVRVEWRVEE
jgi:hypothetical protein